METQGTHFEFCRKSVQQHDPDRYLVSLMARESRALWVLFAFHHEIAKTRMVVSEPTLGLIRLQWWRDEIEKIFVGEVFAAGEVLAGLADIVAAYDLPQELLEAMIAAREIEVRGEQPEGVDGALSFLDVTEAPLCMLMARITGEDEGRDPVAAVALNYGIMDALRRASESSLVGQNRAAFEATFVNGVRCESRALRAMQVLSEIWMTHLRSGYNGKPPAFLALRVWTRILWL